MVFCFHYFYLMLLLALSVIMNYCDIILTLITLIPYRQGVEETQGKSGWFQQPIYNLILWLQDLRMNIWNYGQNKSFSKTSYFKI